MSAMRNLQILSPVMDVAGALRRLGEDVELLEQIILIFLEDAPGLVHSAREALSRGDAGELRRSAHSLKGMMATLGAQAGQHAALRIEQCAASGNLEDASSLICDGGERVSQMTAVLQAYLASDEKQASAGGHSSARASMC
jgi:HPt (histidine-containing phosphotransfer) domain-containing protein